MPAWATSSSSASANTPCACGSIRCGWRPRLTASDVVNALREQNVQVAAGQVGQPPARTGQSYQISVRAVGRLSDPNEFENIVIKTRAPTAPGPAA